MRSALRVLACERYRAAVTVAQDFADRLAIDTPGLAGLSHTLPASPLRPGWIECTDAENSGVRFENTEDGSVTLERPVAICPSERHSDADIVAWCAGRLVNLFPGSAIVQNAEQVAATATIKTDRLLS